MSWHVVVIPHVEGAFEVGHDLIRAFIILFKAAGRPADVAILYNRNDAGEHRYYFSPAASTLAVDLLPTYQATICAAPAEMDSLYGFHSMTIH